MTDRDIRAQEVFNALSEGVCVVCMKDYNAYPARYAMRHRFARLPGLPSSDNSWKINICDPCFYEENNASELTLTGSNSDDLLGYWDYAAVGSVTDGQDV